MDFFIFINLLNYKVIILYYIYLNIFTKFKKYKCYTASFKNYIFLIK